MDMRQACKGALNHKRADLDPPQNSGQKCLKRWTNTHANKQANGPKAKAQRGYFTSTNVTTHGMN